MRLVSSLFLKAVLLYGLLTVSQAFPISHNDKIEEKALQRRVDTPPLPLPKQPIVRPSGEPVVAPRGEPEPSILPWMSEAVDLTKEKNFFETRVTEYETTGALHWDDRKF